MKYIEESAKRSPRTPFFLYVPLTSPHFPVVPAKEFQGKSQAGDYGDFVVQTDAVVGEILRALDENGLADDTLVIFTSDNGCSPAADVKGLEKKGHFPSGQFRGYKADIWEGGHHIPFIARWPGHIPTGSTSDQLISHIDTLATLAALTGQKLSTGAGSDSLNVLPALLEEKRGPALRNHLVLQNNGPSPLALRQGNWVLIEKGGGKKSTQPKAGAADISFELYDLTSDIAQKNNRAGSEPERVKIMAELLAKLRQQP